MAAAVSGCSLHQLLALQPAASLPATGRCRRRRSGGQLLGGGGMYLLLDLQRFRGMDNRPRPLCALLTFKAI
jgi:hypothetical protein